MPPCEYCNESGKCGACDGTGQLAQPPPPGAEPSSSEPQDISCWACDGTGACRHCQTPEAEP